MITDFGTSRYLLRKGNNFKIVGLLIMSLNDFKRLCGVVWSSRICKRAGYKLTREIPCFGHKTTPLSFPGFLGFVRETCTPVHGAVHRG